MVVVDVALVGESASEYTGVSGNLTTLKNVKNANADIVSLTEKNSLQRPVLPTPKRGLYAHRK